MIGGMILVYTRGWYSSAEVEIYDERLDIQFSFEQAMQHSVAVKGSNVNHNTVRQMLKNWRKQGLVVLEQDGNYRKL